MGYSLTPFAHVGACQTDGGSDAGTGVACGTRNDAGLAQFGSCAGTETCCPGGTDVPAWGCSSLIDGGCPVLQ